MISAFSTVVVGARYMLNNVLTTAVTARKARRHLQRKMATSGHHLLMLCALFIAHCAQRYMDYWRAKRAS